MRSTISPGLFSDPESLREVTPFVSFTLISLPEIPRALLTACFRAGSLKWTFPSFAFAASSSAFFFAAASSSAFFAASSSAFFAASSSAFFAASSSAFFAASSSAFFVASSSAFFATSSSAFFAASSSAFFAASSSAFLTASSSSTSVRSSSSAGSCGCEGPLSESPPFKTLPITIQRIRRMRIAAPKITARRLLLRESGSSGLESPGSGPGPGSGLGSESGLGPGSGSVIESTGNSYPQYGHEAFSFTLKSSGNSFSQFGHISIFPIFYPSPLM